MEVVCKGDSLSGDELESPVSVTVQGRHFEVLFGIIEVVRRAGFSFTLCS